MGERPYYEPERQRLARAGLARATSRLDQIEEPLLAIERLAFAPGEIEQRVEALERRAGYRAARRQGLSITAISQWTRSAPSWRGRLGRRQPGGEPGQWYPAYGQAVRSGPWALPPSSSRLGPELRLYRCMGLRRYRVGLRLREAVLRRAVLGRLAAAELGPASRMSDGRGGGRLVLGLRRRARTR